MHKQSDSERVEKRDESIKPMRKQSAMVLILVLLLCSIPAAQAVGGMSLTERVKQAAAMLTPAPKPVRVGDIVTFGRYPQTASGSDSTPIEWQVLEVQPGKVLLLSRYGLDVKPYSTVYTDITWGNCTLRTWLNTDFWSAAFNGAEQGVILTTSVDNSKSQGYSGWNTSEGNNTQDKIFLLSYAEANKYLRVRLYGESGAGNNMGSRVAPTAYARQHGAWVNDDYKTTEGTTSGWWWLRSPGSYQYCAADVGFDGSLSFTSIHIDNGCVRPALWVNLESGRF